MWFRYKKLLLRCLFAVGVCGYFTAALVEHRWTPLASVIPFLFGFVTTFEKKLVQLSGIWAYHVKRSGESFSHAGRCLLEQEGDTVSITGKRFLHAKKGNVNDEVEWDWKTEWSQISPDGHLRFDYGITLVVDATTVHVEGLCRVKILNDNHMSGPYVKIRPVNSDVTEWGTITLRRLPVGSALQPPSGGYDAKGFEIGS